MADSYALVATALKTIIDTEFAPQSIVARHDKLHESLGSQGVEVGISPISQGAQVKRGIIKETLILVQFYNIWDKRIDPTQQVDPFLITGYADRFERRVESSQASSSGNNDLWYYRVVNIDYPDDPTGNKTRFEARVLAVGDNTALTQR